MNHHHQNDQQDQVAVDVAVVVPLLLLVETDFQRVVQLPYSLAHNSLFLQQGLESLLQSLCGAGLSGVFLILWLGGPRIACVAVLRSLLLVFNFPSCFMSTRYAGNTLILRLE